MACVGCMVLTRLDCGDIWRRKAKHGTITTRHSIRTRACQTCARLLKCKEEIALFHVCLDVLDVLDDRRVLWARCSGYEQIIELKYGCFHIICRCRPEFCYCCRAKWKACRCRSVACLLWHPSGRIRLPHLSALGEPQCVPWDFRLDTTEKVRVSHPGIANITSTAVSGQGSAH
ncbi:hypothetical protein BKA93DRAFT_193228 [Sparassis latifolia]